VGDNFVAGVRRLLAVAHQYTRQLVDDAVLHPAADALILPVTS
jgi:hypothetical protein